MPAARRCLAGPDEGGLGDQGIASSAGLSQEQARKALHAFAPQLSWCFQTSDASPTGVLELGIRVGCNGRVSEVEVRDAGDWPGELIECMAETVGYAPFPAHDLPDGDWLVYPLRRL